MHERDEAEFKRQFAASFLAAWAVRERCDQHSRSVRSLCIAVETANLLSDEAWNHWVNVIGVDRSTPETPNHCYRVMDDPSYDQP